MAKLPDFSHGDLVFAKCKGYPPWPARVDFNVNVGKIGKNRLSVFFFGTHEIGSVAIKDVLPYAEFKDKLGKPVNRKSFVEALWEIEHKPNLAIDQKATKPIKVEEVKKPKKEVVSKKPVNQKNTYEESKPCQPKSVYSDFDSDSNDLIIDENVHASYSFKKFKETVAAQKVATKRKYEEELSSLIVQPSQKKVPLRSRKRLKIGEESDETNVKEKKITRLTKKAKENSAVKLKIKIKSTSSVPNASKLNNLSARTRYESRRKEQPATKISFERKDYLEDARERNRHSLLENIVKRCSSKQQDKASEDEELNSETNLPNETNTPTGSVILNKENSGKKVPKGSKARFTKAAKPNKRVIKEAVNDKEEDVPVTRTRCGRIVRTPAALDRDEEIIDLPGFKRNFSRNTRKDTVSSKPEFSVPNSAQKKKNAEKKPLTRAARRGATDDSGTLNCEIKTVESACQPKSEELIECEPRKKIVMTISRHRTAKFRAANKVNNGVAKKVSKVEGKSDVGDQVAAADAVVDAAVVKLIEETNIEEQAAAAAAVLEEPLEEMFVDSPGDLVIVENQEEMDEDKSADSYDVLSKIKTKKLEKLQEKMDEETSLDKSEELGNLKTEIIIENSQKMDEHISEDKPKELSNLKTDNTSEEQEKNDEENSVNKPEVLHNLKTDEVAEIQKNVEDKPVVKSEKLSDLKTETILEKQDEAEEDKSKVKVQKGEAIVKDEDISATASTSNIEMKSENSPENVASCIDSKEAEQEKEKLLQKRRAEKEEEKNRKKREKYEKKKRDKLNRMKVEEKINAIDHKIKDSLHLGEQDIDQCLEAMIELDTVSLNANILKNNPYIVVTIRKCRKYKNSGIVRQKADDLYNKFKDMFLGGDGESFSNLFEKDKSSRTSSKSLSTDTEIDTSTDNQDVNGAAVSEQEADNNRIPSLPVGACVPGQDSAKTKKVVVEKSTKDSKESKNSATSTSKKSVATRSTSNKDSGTKPKKK